jgi:hypothetical protein
MCRNVRSIEWHQKTYHEISWDYPFKVPIYTALSSKRHFISWDYPFKRWVDCNVSSRIPGLRTHIFLFFLSWQKCLQLKSQLILISFWSIIVMNDKENYFFLSVFTKEGTTNILRFYICYTTQCRLYWNMSVSPTVWTRVYYVSNLG